MKLSFDRSRTTSPSAGTPLVAVSRISTDPMSSSPTSSKVRGSDIGRTSNTAIRASDCRVSDV